MAKKTNFSAMVNKDNVCPSCGAKVDGASSLDSEHGPKPGDMSVCLYCAELMQFKDDLSVGHVDPEALEHIDLTQLQEAQRFVRVYQATANGRLLRLKADKLNSYSDAIDLSLPTKG